MIPIAASFSEKGMRGHEKLPDFIEKNSIDCAHISHKMLRIFKSRIATTDSEQVTGIFRDDIRILNCYGSSESAGVSTSPL